MPTSDSALDLNRNAVQTDAVVTVVLHRPLPGRALPPYTTTSSLKFFRHSHPAKALVSFLRTIRPAAARWLRRGRERARGGRVLSAQLMLLNSDCDYRDAQLRLQC
jgi:hypothetical protein